MAKNILVVVGSPRVGGNTDALADAFIKGAEEAGNRVVKSVVGRMNIHGCMDCKHCFTDPGVCAQKDDMQMVYPALADADVLVIASPLYFCGFTAQTKAFIDRMFAFYKTGYRIKSSALLMVCGDARPTEMDPPISVYRAIARVMGLKNLGAVTAAGLNDKGDIAGNPALEQARRLGLSIH